MNPKWDASDASRAQLSPPVTHFVILTVRAHVPPLSVFATGGAEYFTVARTVTLPEATQSRLYEWAVGQLPQRLQGGAVLFYRADPDQMGGVS